MWIVQRSLRGFMRLGGRRLYCAILFLVLVWLAIFCLLMPIFMHAAWLLGERAAVGSLSPTFPPHGQCAFATLVTGAGYVRGARVLAHTLRLHSRRDGPLVALTLKLSDRDKQVMRVHRVNV